MYSIVSQNILIMLDGALMATPRHIAFIMDGNGRWAQKRGLPRSDGHKAGYKHITEVLEICNDNCVEVVSCFAWSTENWDRPEQEVRFILRAVEKELPRFVKELHDRGVRFIHSGDTTGLSLKAKKILCDGEDLTMENGPRIFNLVFNYGGRADIVQAARTLLERGATAEDVNEASISEYLWTKGLPDVDLVIRTGGDRRISNFLLWQGAFALIYVVNSYWPDLSREDIAGGIEYYNKVVEHSG
jgi:undecaprenyl diphosphate synthase